MIIIDQKKTILVTILIELICGALFLIFPTGIQNFIVYVFGALIIATGLALLFFYFKNRRQFIQQLVAGIILALVGTGIILLNNFILAIIPIIIGVIMLLRGINKIATSWFFRDRNNLWFIDFFCGIALVIIGIVLIFMNGTDIIGYIAGSFILFEALIDTTHLLVLKKFTQDTRNYYDQTFNDSNEIKNDVIDVDYTERKDEEE